MAGNGLFDNSITPAVVSNARRATASPSSASGASSATNSLALQGRRYRVVYNSSSLAGQIAAVESGLAAAVLPQCSVPPHLEILGGDHGLGPLEPMEVSIYRSPASMGSEAVDSLYELLARTLRSSTVS